MAVVVPMEASTRVTSGKCRATTPPLELRPMPTRIDIELTSAGSDGSWTWRAAGAREPRGTLDGSLLPVGASVGDQLKVEMEHDLDGIRIISIVTPKEKPSRDGILELLPSADFEPVIQQRATRDRHESDRDRPHRGRGDRSDRERRPDRPGRATERGDRVPAEGAARTGGGERRGGPRREEGGERGAEDRRHQRPHFTPPPELPQRPKPKRLRPGKQRRNDVLAAIPEEQRPVAELALQGLAAVRQRVREDNAKLKAEDKPEMPEATVLKMAENLIPQLRVADWLDRAEAAKRQLAHLDLRDLRSVVAAADDPVVARDESTRELATELKAALITKQDEELNLWLADVEAAVDVGRIVRALRLSAMPPKAGVPFPSQLGSKLVAATTAALTPEDPADRWIAVLEAAAFAPIRTLVTPAAAPAQPAADLVATVTRLAPLLPQVAALFGIEVSAKAPTPKPLRPTPRKKESTKAGAGASTEPRGNVATHPGPNPKPERPPKPERSRRPQENVPVATPPAAAVDPAREVDVQSRAADDSASAPTVGEAPPQQDASPPGAVGASTDAAADTSAPETASAGPEPATPTPESEPAPDAPPETAPESVPAPDAPPATAPESVPAPLDGPDPVVEPESSAEPVSEAQPAADAQPAANSEPVADADR